MTGTVGAVRSGRIAIPVTAAVLLCCAAGFAYGLAGPAPLFKEGGAVESASAATLAALAAALALSIVRAGRPDLWHLPALAAILAARELDLDKSLLSDGIFKSNFYSGPAPLWEKAVGLAVVLLVLTVLWRSARGAWRAARSGSGDAALWTALAATGIVAVAKAIDGIGRKLEPLGMAFEPATLAAFGHVEESMELTFALLLVLALHLWLAREEG